MTWTEYQGVKVIDAQPEPPTRHPRWGNDPERLAKLKGATLLLLEDGTMVVICDDCNYNGLTKYEPYAKPDGDYRTILEQANSVSSHRNSTHGRVVDHHPLYSDEVIKVAIKVFLKWKATGVQGWARRAAEELDRLGFKPYRGDRWTGSNLGGLVRTYTKKQRFKNIKAAPMNGDDQGTLAELVREAAAREGIKGNTILAANARITERKTPHRHTPVDFDKIIADNQAAKIAEQSQVVEQQKEEATVSASSNSPILNFVGPGVAPEPVPTMTLPVASVRQPLDAPVAHARKSAPMKTSAVLTSVDAQPNDFQHVVTLPDGTPMFLYKGQLMVGKLVKGVEV